MNRIFRQSVVCRLRLGRNGNILGAGANLELITLGGIYSTQTGDGEKWQRADPSSQWQPRPGSSAITSRLPASNTFSKSSDITTTQPTHRLTGVDIERLV